MKDFLTFISILLLSAIRYLSLILGIVLLIIGGIDLAKQNNPKDSHSLLILLAGLGLIFAGLVVTYFAVKRDKKEFGWALLADFVMFLLPPW